MSDSKMKKPLTLAVGAALAASLAPMGASAATDGLFSLTSLSSGYMIQTITDDADAEGSCGEGRCGGDDHTAEGHCGAAADGDADAEGSCGEGRCGGDHEAEGSCGADHDAEGSCGGDHDAEGSCGADHDAEGSCGGDDADAEAHCGGDEGHCGSA